MSKLSRLMLTGRDKLYHRWNGKHAGGLVQHS